MLHRRLSVQISGPSGKTPSGFDSTVWAYAYAQVLSVALMNNTVWNACKIFHLAIKQEQFLHKAYEKYSVTGRLLLLSLQDKDHHLGRS